MTQPMHSGSGAAWARVPVLLLGSMLVGLGALAYVAVDDPHFALEPNYYQKAVNWDLAQREARESAALGLELTLLRPLALGVDGTIEIEVRVTDRERAAFGAAVVELEAFPNAYASRIQHVTLQEASPGVYRARLDGGDSGLWELRFGVARGAARFHQSLRREVTKGRAT